MLFMVKASVRQLLAITSAAFPIKSESGRHRRYCTFADLILAARVIYIRTRETLVDWCYKSDAMLGVLSDICLSLLSVYSNANGEGRVRHP